MEKEGNEDDVVERSLMRINETYVQSTQSNNEHD